MHLPDFPFTSIDWTDVPSEEHKGETGKACWKIKYIGETRVRIVEYSPGYSADHWCSKGHILHIIKGELITELKDGRKFFIKEGMSYIVGDETDPHRSSTEDGAVLLIID